MCHSTIETVTTAPETSVPSSAGHPAPLNKLADVDGYACSLWPFNPGDLSPLQWWRTMPADHLGDAQHLLLRTMLQDISTIKGGEWLAGLRDNAAVCVAVALGALPITKITFEVDLAISALTVSALGGNAGSVLVLSHVLRLAPLDHPFARELSVSWLALNLRRGGSLVTAKVADGDKARLEAVLDTSSVNLRDRSAAWQKNGWTGYDPASQPYDAEEVRKERTLYR